MVLDHPRDTLTAPYSFEMDNLKALSATLPPASGEATATPKPKGGQKTAAMIAYIAKYSPSFVTLCKLREQVVSPKQQCSVTDADHLAMTIRVGRTKMRSATLKRSATGLITLPKRRDPTSSR